MGCMGSKVEPNRDSFAIVRHKSGSMRTLPSEEIRRTTSDYSIPQTPLTEDTIPFEPKHRRNSVHLYNGTTAGSKKDQDRFITIPDLFPDVFFTGVFDGHAQNGAVFAERAGTEFARLLREKMGWLQDMSHSAEPVNVEEFTTRATADLTAVFADIQQMFATEYEKEVQIPLEKEHKKFEKSEGIALPLSLPMIGGTTATIVLVVGPFMVVSWVGDSRAVMCQVNSDGAICAVDLTVDHNVESNATERSRAIAAGGAVAGRHIAVDGAEGMLQTLRSLGDVPHHKNDIVTAVPEVNVFRLDPEQHPFVVLASDGIWHHRTSLEVVGNIFKELNEVAEEMSSDDLVRVCQKSTFELNGWVKEHAAQSDDIVMSTFTVLGYDWKKKNGTVKE